MIDLKLIRLEQKMTLNNVSQLTGLAISQIKRYEKYFDAKNMSLKNLSKIAKAYNMKIYDLIEDESFKVKLIDTFEYETGIFLDGDVSPVAELADIFGMTQTEMSNRSGIAQPQISEWFKHGMDNAKLKNFFAMAYGLHINALLFVWDTDMFDLVAEVI